MRLRMPALLACLALPAQAAPDNQALAERLVSDLGGFEQIARTSAQTAINMGVIKSPVLYRQVYDQYLKDHHDLIAKTDSLMAAVFAKTYSDDELNSYIAYEESDMGRAIFQKQIAATQSIFSGQYRPAVLTPEEKAAQDAFYASPQGKTLSRKYAQALAGFVVQVAPYMQQLTTGTIDQYCKQGGDCSNLRVVHPGDALKQ